MYLNDWLGRRTMIAPHATAVVDDAARRHYSYADLQRRATWLANHLAEEFGVRPADRIACLASNRIEYLDLYFACGKLGAVLVPLNSRIPQDGLIELLVDSRPRLLVYEPLYEAIASAARQREIVPSTVCLDASTASVIASELARSIERGAQTPVQASADVYAASEADVAMILYTSGTTGVAKGAMISYRQIHWNALNTIIGLQLTQDDVAYLNLPLYHTGGWHVLFTPLMLVGGRIVLQPRFDAARCNELLGPERITILFGIPTTMRMMWEAANFAEADFSSVRFAIFGGESCPLPLIEAFRERGIAMRQGYGLTEAGPNCFSLPTKDATRKAGSIGFPNFFVGTRLVTEDGSACCAGQVGELQMCGPHLFAGYWGRDADTRRVLSDGWLATGDLMTRDEEGYYYVVGRKNDMFVSGGENIYPAQVERVLQQHEAVTLAAVIGQPDAQWGEAGWAFVQLREQGTVEPEDLVTWCRQRLAKYQCPVKMIIAAELPLGTSGKVDKLALAKLAARISSELP